MRPVSSTSSGATQPQAWQSTDDFDAWVRPHWPMVRMVAERVAGPVARDDALQEALLSAWRGCATVAMRCAEGTVKATLSAARTNLRDQLSQEFS